MYKAFIHSTMEYCSPLWAGASTSHLSHIDVVETKTIQIIGIFCNEAEFLSLLDWKLITLRVFSETAEQIEAKLHIYDRLSMTNKKFSPSFDVQHILWQPYWIEGKILINVYSGTATSINVKLQKDDAAYMCNEGFKFQLDRPHGLAAMLDWRGNIK